MRFSGAGPKAHAHGSSPGRIFLISPAIPIVGPTRKDEKHACARSTHPPCVPVERSGCGTIKVADSGGHVLRRPFLWRGWRWKDTNT
jgi:hypothetical protein